MKIRFLNVPHPEDFKQYEKYLPCISRERSERISTMKRPGAKSMCLLAEVLMRREIGKALGIKESEIIFSYGEQGKPYIRNINSLVQNSGYDFSISHTENVIVFADSQVSIGIDIEKVKSARLKVAERFFTKEEYERILALLPGKSDSEFYRIWTMKEAYVKMSGQGLRIPLNSFDVVDSEKLQVFFYNEEYKGFSISLCREGVDSEKVDIVECFI